jgi:hypothetical protein
MGFQQLTVEISQEEYHLIYCSLFSFIADEGHDLESILNE